MTAPLPPPRGLVLVADDDPVMRLLMRQMLTQVGLDVIEAEDGVQALASYKHSGPDLVMLDVDMPALDGFAVCREIRRQEVGGTVPIIMVTGDDELEAVTRAYEVGATDSFPSPSTGPSWAIARCTCYAPATPSPACASPTRTTVPCWPPSPIPSFA